VPDAAGEHVALHRAHFMLHAVDDQHLCPAQHDPELLVLVAVQRHGGARLELDQVHHRPLAEQGLPGDARGELERADVVEVDEVRLHAAIVRSWTTARRRSEWRVRTRAR
jgi:hypothetical protein